MFDKYLTKTGLLSSKQPQYIKNRWYIEKFRKVHGDKYDYSSVEYEKSNSEVSIYCPFHGLFRKTPNHHLQGQGCPKCSDLLKPRMDTASCLKGFHKIHGNTYDYSLVQYTNTYTKVKILCKTHGEFLQTPNAHLRGQGCPRCGSHNQNILYVLKCLNTGLFKIGITNNLQKRISSIGGKLEHVFHITIENPRELEKHLHDKYQLNQVFNAYVSSGGTEFFSLSDQQVEELICFLSQHQDQ